MDPILNLLALIVALLLLSARALYPLFQNPQFLSDLRNLAVAFLAALGLLIPSPIEQTPTPTPSDTPTPIATATPLPTPTPLPTSTPAPTPTPIPTPTPLPTPPVVTASAPAFFDADHFGSANDQLARQSITATGLSLICGLHAEPSGPDGLGNYLPGNGGGIGAEQLLTEGCIPYVRSDRTIFIVGADKNWNTFSLDAEEGTAPYEVYVFGRDINNSTLYIVPVWDQSNGMLWGWRHIEVHLFPGLSNDTLSRVEIRKTGGKYQPVFDNITFFYQ